jgi:peptidoglycan/LPS O-acetylase OafA/YrhL
MPELEALRGMAALMVVSQHVRTWSGVESTSLDALWVGQWGNWAVSFFFVLSGLLITSGLLARAECPDYYRDFYCRRALRIVPLYFAVLVIGIVLAYHYGSPLRLDDVALFVGFLGNISVMLAGPRLFDPFRPMWALAVEAQFYLCWPWLVRQIRPLRFLGLCIGLIALSVAMRYLIFHLVPNGKGWNHYWMLSRLDGFAMGAMIATALYLRRLHESNFQQFAVTWATVSWVAFVMIRGQSLERLGITGTVEAAFVTSWLVLALAYRSHPVVTGALANPVLVFLGKISYGVYLLHAFVIAVLTDGMTQPMAIASFPLQCLIVVGSATSLATISWKYVESPILSRWKRPRMAV